MPEVSPAAASRDGSRWMGVGHSADADARRAGAEATRQALHEADPKLLIVFSGHRYDPRALYEGIAEAAPGVPVIGCSTSGEIATEGPADGTAVVTAIGGAGFSVATASDANISGRQREAGAAVAECAAQVPDLEYKVLLLLTDGLARLQENVLRGAYSVVGAGVPLFGGGATGPSPELCYQIHNGRVLHDGVVAATIASDAPIGIGISHGWRKVGEAMVVTRSDKARVYTLDKEPALDKYLRALNAPPEVYHDPEAFSAWSMTRPLGVQRRSGVAAKNISQDVDFEGRSIGGGTEMVQGALVWATEGDSDSILDATEVACQDAVDALGGNKPIGLLAMSCMGCKVVLGHDGVEQESKRIAGRARGAPFAGFHTHGEICRTRGVEGFHNQTLVVLALS
jgi:hypothetical protein